LTPRQVVLGIRQLQAVSMGNLERAHVSDQSSGSNPVVGLRGGFDDRQNLERVKADGAGQNDQFDDVNPALAAFDACHEGLMAFEPVRQVFLTEARSDPGVDQRLAQSLLSRASDCFCHASHTFCDVASG